MNTDPLPRFLQRLTHDLSSSLMAAQGFADLLRDHLGSEVESKSALYLNRISRAIARAEEQLDHLRHFYQATEAPLEAVPLADVLPEVILQVLDRAGDADIHLPDDLPVVQAHARLLTILLVEVISNAAIYVAPDRNATVEVSFSLQNGWCDLEVADDGIGIPEAARDLVVQPMIRACEEEIYPGVGLGLSIAQRAAAAMGGQLSLAPRDGGGTICTVRLSTGG